MTQSADQAEHDLRAGVGARTAVRLAVDDERVPGGSHHQRHAALDAVPLPHDSGAHQALPRRQLVGRREGPGRNAARTDAPMTPDRRRSVRAQHDRDGGRRGEARHQHHPSPPVECADRVAPRQPGGGDAEDEEEDRREPPRAGRRQPRDQAKTAGKRSRDPAERVGGIRHADFAADALAPAAEQRNQERKLVTGDQRRRQNDEKGDKRPSGDGCRKSRGPHRQQHHRQRGDAVAKCERRRHGRGLEQA